MRTALQAIIAFMTIVLAMVTVAVWFNNQASGQLLWILRVACPVFAIAFFVILLQLIHKPDLVPDYLSMNFGSCFEQDGLLFHIAPKLEDDNSFWVMIYFQNQFENPCEVDIGLHPQLPVRSNPISARFTCEAAAFGVAKVPLLDASMRGQKSTWEIVATVQYPKGKRKQLRFREGKAAKTITFEIPPFIKHDQTLDPITHTKTLWKLGDPPLT